MNYNKLKEHLGHNVIIYLKKEGLDEMGITLECDDCGEVIEYYDNPDL
jgi:hypothetical protein